MFARTQTPDASLAGQARRRLLCHLLGWSLAAIAFVPPPAHAAQVQCGSASGLAGATIDIPITSSTPLTGLGVLALQFELNYNPAIATPIAIVQTGSLTGTAGWSAAEFSVQPISASQSRLAVSTAGTNALAGTGPLLFLRYALEPTLIAGGATGLNFVSFTYNEGSPTDTTAGGTLTVSPTPQITVSPASAVVYRSSTQQFTASGATAPVTWSTTDPAIAGISATGLLTGLAPGSVRVIAVDAAARRDTSNGVVEVRGMRLTAGSGSVVQGFNINIPLVATSISGLGVRSGQITLTYNPALLTPTAVLAPSGTLLNGFGPVGFGVPLPGTVIVDFAGNHDLAGTGTLCQIQFTASDLATGTSALTLTSALFNELLPAVTVNGSVQVTGIGTLNIAPDQVTLLAGQTQQFTVTGSPTPTPPISWSVVDPAVASIGPTGLLTALAGGDTQVRAQDSLGALDFTTAVHVYDFALTVGTVQATPGATLRIPLLADRVIGGLGIHSFQYALQWTGTSILGAHASSSGLASLWHPTGLVTLSANPRINVAGAGATPLDDSDTDLHGVEFDLSPAAVPGTNVPLTLSGLVFNEGTPRALVTQGAIQVRNTADVGERPAVVLGLAPCEPNPMRDDGRIRL
ncbi:MAG: Ig-like domain-containing protein, partial [Candidatus Eisenbacteria bacterium]